MSNIKKELPADISNDQKLRSGDQDPNDFVAVSREELLANNVIPMDVFLKISDTKWVLIGRKGSKSLDEMHVVGDKSASTFFARKEDYKDSVGHSLIVAGTVVKRTDVTDRVKMAMVSRTTDSVFREIEKIGFNHESLEHAKNISKSIQTLVASQADLLGVMTILSEVSGDLLRHSMAASAVSIMIAKSMGWTMSATIEKLALGGLLHDIGMKELPKDVLEKPRHELTNEQRQIYESHVFRGMEILGTMPSVHDDVVAIVSEHHENAIAQGYPRRLRDIKMNPLAKVVALADCFCELTLKNVNHPQPKTADQAINYIEFTLGQPFSKPAFLGLKVALNHVSVGAKKKVV
jgi:putative nucleotidyltransferase with HDIG domain